MCSLLQINFCSYWQFIWSWTFTWKYKRIPKLLSSISFIFCVTNTLKGKKIQEKQWFDRSQAFSTQNEMNCNRHSINTVSSEFDIDTYWLKMFIFKEISSQNEKHLLTSHAFFQIFNYSWVRLNKLISIKEAKFEWKSYALRWIFLFAFLIKSAFLTLSFVMRKKEKIRKLYLKNESILICSFCVI